jgi:hypothetical protein
MLGTVGFSRMASIDFSRAAAFIAAVPEGHWTTYGAHRKRAVPERVLRQSANGFAETATPCLTSTACSRSKASSPTDSGLRDPAYRPMKHAFVTFSAKKA